MVVTSGSNGVRMCYTYKVCMVVVFLLYDYSWKTCGLIIWVHTYMLKASSTLLSQLQTIHTDMLSVYRDTITMHIITCRLSAYYPHPYVQVSH